MTLKPLAGHAVARRRLSQAVASGALPQVILVSGPEGVGKQRLALWTAQLLLCEAPGAEPCGQCRSCRLVLGLTHAGPALDRSNPPPQGRGTGQAGRGGRREHRRGPRGATGRAALRPGGRDVGPRDGHGAPDHAARGADPRRGPAQGVHPRRSRAPGSAGVEPGSGERPSQVARGAAGGNLLPAHRRGSGEAPPHHPLACGAVAGGAADRRRGAGISGRGTRSAGGRGRVDASRGAGGGVDRCRARGSRAGPGNPQGGRGVARGGAGRHGPGRRTGPRATRLVRARRVHRSAGRGRHDARRRGP